MNKNQLKQVIKSAIKNSIKNSTLKSFQKHGLHEEATNGLNSLVQSGHLMPLLKEGDNEHHMVTTGGRHMVLANINGQPVPFYHSTGKGGKEGVAKGQWYPIMGIGHKAHHEIIPGKERGGVWLNKTNEKDINSYYGSPHLSGFAKHLDSITGNMLGKNVNTHELEKLHDDTYDAYVHPETGQRATRKEVNEWNQKNGGEGFKKHSEGPSTNFLGDFASNINRKMGIEAVHSPEESDGQRKVSNNAKTIISNIENSQTPNITLPEEAEKQWRSENNPTTNNDSTPSDENLKSIIKSAIKEALKSQAGQSPSAIEMANQGTPIGASATVPGVGTEGSPDNIRANKIRDLENKIQQGGPDVTSYQDELAKIIGGDVPE